MLSLLRKDVVKETLDAHAAKLFDTDAADEGFPGDCQLPVRLWRRLQFSRGRTDTGMEEMRYSNAYEAQEPIDGIQTFDVDSERLLSCSESGDDKVFHGKFLMCSFKH